MNIEPEVWGSFKRPPIFIIQPFLGAGGSRLKFSKRKISWKSVQQYVLMKICEYIYDINYSRSLQEKLDQLLSEYEKEAGNIDAAIKKEMQKSQQGKSSGQNQKYVMRKKYCYIR